MRGTSAAVARQMGAPAPGCHEGVRSRLDADRRLHGVLDEHGRAVWSTVSPWRVVAVAGVCAALLAVMLGVTVGLSRLARRNRADTTVVLLCGSKRNLASGLPMALVFFGTRAVDLIMLPLILFHQIQLFVCAVIATRMSRTVQVD